IELLPASAARQKTGAVRKILSFGIVLSGGACRHTLRHTWRTSMPLTLILDLALNKTAGRKGGDESDPPRDHRVTSKPCKSVISSIAELETGHRMRSRE